MVSESQVTLLNKLLLADPRLPRQRPTTSYWLNIEHELANHQSESFAKTTDIAIIGSGICGTSISYHLLNRPDSQDKLTVFEARTLCSGATGRNGGNLITYGALGYLDLCEAVGPEFAVQIIDFTLQNVEETAAVLNKYAKEESQIRPTTRIHSYRDLAIFEMVTKSVNAYIEKRPSARDNYKIISAEAALKDYGLHGVVGAVTYTGYAMWPYRAITRLWEVLLKEHPSRLSLETNTAVSEVSYDPEGDSRRPYIVHTPRGNIRATRVVYATNGYSAHLLPALRGILFPYRETVTVQDLNSAEIPIHSDRSWAVVQHGTVDAKSKRCAPDLLYLHQNPVSGYFWFGGEYNTAQEILNADDDRLDPESVRYLQRNLNELLGVQEQHKNKLISAWSGVQGMTSDHAPLIGRLPSQLTGRQGNNEWIAAGYNGGGMAMCWLAARSISEMMYGVKRPAYLPEPFTLTADRLQNKLTFQKSISWTAELLP